MTLTAYEDDDFFKTMEEIAARKMRGESDTSIARNIGLPRKQVISLYNQYKEILSEDSEARDLARDHLYQMVKHFDSLIAKYYSLIEEIDTLSFNHQVAGQKNAAIKAISELESKRLDALQKAGLLDSADLGDELAQMEEDKELLVSILRDDLCPVCKTNIAEKWKKLTGQVDEIDDTIDVEVVDE